MASTKAAVVSDFRRAQILDAARAAFARHGLADTTIDHIARGARVAKGTVYLYFRSKDEILRQLLDDALAELYRETVPPLAAPGPCREKLRQFLERTLDFFDRHRDLLEQCHFELTPDMRRKARRAVGRIFTAQTKAWQAELARAARGRRVRAVSSRRAACGVVSLAYGLGQQRLRGWAAEPRDQAVAWASALLLKGLAVS
ncbi:MAG TPA: helix-turn-helix domain-containing protein [Thermoanaerobaculia bacterium]|nr:helix-turn-helix domain-containing protein [Thermoanaerobaculia bacterium]